MQGGGQQQKPTWYKPRDDMDKRRSCANCGSADHHVADGLTYRQGMISLGYAPDEEHMSQTEEHEFYSSLIIKIQSLQDGLSPFMGSSEESESPKTQVGTCCGA